MSELPAADLQLILEALDDAMLFRDGRSKALANAVRRSSRKYPGRGEQEGSGAEADRRKAREYAALVARLKPPRE